MEFDSLIFQHNLFLINCRWRPILGVEEILLSVVSMLNDPNIDSPANVDAAVK